jgi:hypothetical protein
VPTVPLPITALGSTGTAFPTILDSSTRQGYYSMSLTADSFVHFRGYVPDDYASAGAIVLHVIANATTGVHRLGVDVAVAKDGEDQDPTLTALTEQDITVPGTAYLQDRVTFSSGLPTIEAGDVIFGRALRNGDHANDTLAVVTLLSGIFFTYTA